MILLATTSALVNVKPLIVPVAVMFCANKSATSILAAVTDNAAIFSEVTAAAPILSAVTESAAS